MILHEGVLLKMLVLIDTWWNVNVGRIAEFYGADGVLIDTWWNVNFLSYMESVQNVLVLIDTWWNVNRYNTKYTILSSFQF